MFINEYGDKNDPHVLLLAPMMVSGEDLYQLMHPYFKHDYHYIAPEENEHVPVWNHDIMLKAVDAKHTRYTDRVEIQAGWKTVFIWLWANVFYAHRQRKWIRLLKREEV